MFGMCELNRKLKYVLRRDSNFLIQHGFLDYSLLIAIEKCDKAKADDAQTRLLLRSVARGIVKRQDCRKIKDEINILTQTAGFRKSNLTYTNVSRGLRSDSFMTDEDMREHEEMVVQEEVFKGD